MKWRAFLLCFLLGFSFVSHASDSTIGEYLKKIQDKQKWRQLKKKKSFVPTVSSGKSQDAQPVNLSDIIPPKTSARRTLRMSVEKNENLVDQEIDQLYKIIKKFKNKKYRGEFWLRLGEAYLHKSAFIEERLNKRYDKLLLKYQKRKIKKRPHLNLKPVYTYYIKAVKLYKLYVDNFPKGDKIDYALFLLGFTYVSWNKEEEGFSFYQKLISEHPKSPYVDQALQSSGDFYFHRDRWALAKRYYKKISKKPKSKFYIASLYKLSWCEFKVGNVGQAVKGMTSVYELAKKDPKNYYASESRKDLIEFYVELPSSYKKARRFFSQFFPIKLIDSVMEILAYQYSISGKKSQASYHLRDLIKRNHWSLKAYKYQNEILKIYSSKGNSAGYQKQLYSMAKQYGPSSVWASKQTRHKELRKIILSLKKKLEINALKMHKNYENSHSARFKKLAMLAYKNYFHFYNSGDNFPKLKFYYGELLFEAKEYKEALAQYRWIIHKAPKDKFYEDSLFNALLALEKIIPSIAEIQKRKTLKMNAWIEAFVEIGELYVIRKPNNIEIKKRLATIYYYYGQKEKSLKYLNHILLASEPDTQTFKTSFNLIVAFYNEKKDYESLVQFLDFLLERKKGLKSIPLASDIQKIRQRSEFKSLSKKDVSQFEKFYETHKGSALSYQALFNAALSYEKKGELLKAYKAYKKLSKIEAKTKEEKEFVLSSYRFLAQFYGKTAQFTKQFSVFERLSQIETKPQLVLENYYNIAVISELLERYALASDFYRKYYDGLSKTQKKSEILYKIARNYEKINNFSKATFYYQRYLNSAQFDGLLAVQAAFKLSEIYEKKKQFLQVKIWQKRVLSLYRKYKKGSSFAAEAHFKILSNDEYKKFKKIKFSKVTSEKILNKKLNAFNRVVKDYGKVIKYDNPDMIVASLYTLGKASQNVYEFIQNSPLPKGLNKKEKAEYKKQLSLQTQPFSDKAFDFYEEARKKAFEFEVYGKWFEKVLKGSQNLMMSQFTVRKEKVFSLKPLLSVQESGGGLDKENFFKSVSRNDYRRALSLGVKKLSKNPDDVDILNGLALLHIKKNRYVLARHLFNKAIELKPERGGLYNNMAIVFLKEHNLSEALRFFKKGLSKSKSEVGLIALNLGQVYLDNKDYKKASLYLEKGMQWAYINFQKREEISPQSMVFLRNNLAVSMAGAGEFVSAVAIYEALLKDPESNVNIMINYVMLMIQKRQFEKADKVLSEIKLISSDSRILKWVRQMRNKIREG